MKFKNIMPFLFIFSMIFVNLIPTVSLFMPFNSAQNSYESQILLNGLFNNQYILGLLYMFVLFAFIKFCRTYNVSEKLIKSFSLGYFTVVLLSLSTSRGSSIIELLYSTIIHNIGFGRSDSSMIEFIKLFNNLLNIGLLVLLCIVFVLIISEIKYVLNNYVAIVLSTIFYSAFTVVLLLVASSILKIDNSELMGVLSLLAMLSLIFFKLVLINEAISYMRIEDNQDSNKGE